MSDANIRAVITAEDKASATLRQFGDNAHMSFGKMAGAVALGQAAFATAQAAVQHLSAAIKDTIDTTVSWTKGTIKLQRELGVTSESASGLMAVGKRYGLTVDDLSKSLGLFARHVTDAAAGNQTAIDTFQHFGLSVKDVHGNVKNFDTLFGETADKFKNAPAGFDKTAEALKLFGRSGKDLLPILNLGREGIQQLEEEAAKYGLVLSSTNVAAVKKYIVAQRNMEEAMTGIKLQIGQALMPVLSNLATHLSTLLPQAFKFLKDNMDKIKPLIPEIAGLIGGLLISAVVALGISLWGAVAPILPFILAGEALIAAVVLIVQHLGGWHKVTQDLKNIYAFFRPLIKDIGDYLGNNFKNALIGVKEIFKKLSEEMKPMIDFIKQHKEGFKQIAEVLAIIAALPIIAFFATMMAAFGALAVVIKFVGDHFQLMKTIIATVMFGIVGLIVSNWGAITNFLVGAVSGIINFFAGAWNWLYNAGRGIIGGLVNGIQAVAGTVWNAIKGAADNIGSFFKGAASWLFETGKAIIHGLADGIKAAAGSAMDAIKRVGSDIINAAKSILHIKSPSKIFAEIGQNVSLGMAEGITDKSAAPVKSAQDMSQGVIQGGTPQTTVQPSSNIFNITLQVGAFMGSQQDARKYALMIMDAYKDALAVKGVRV